MTDANDIRNEFSPLLDDELSPDARHAVEAELAQDADLLRELDALRRIDNMYRDLPRVSAPDDLAARVRDRLHPKPNVLPLRTRRMSRTLYTSLAAAAMFSVVIGGIVLRQEFFVSRTAEERLAASSADVEYAAGEAAPARGALGDAGTPAPLVEVDAPSAGREAGIQAERSRDDLAQTELPTRQESAEASAVAEAQPPEADRGIADMELKNEAQAQAVAPSAAAPPPPAPPMPSEAPALGGFAGAAAEPPMAVGPDKDGVDAPGAATANRSNQKTKEANTVKRIANREFDQREDGWYQRGYEGEPTQIVLRDSETLAGLISEIADLDDALQLEGDIVFRHGVTWYRVRAETAVSP